MFKNIEFGLADARNELDRLPQLLLDGFFDQFGYTRELAKGDRFLVLGPKGSGKSALGGRLELLSRAGTNSHVHIYDLGGFPFDAFTGVLPGKEALDIRLPENWEFILLMCIVESLTGDPTARSTGAISFRDVFLGLESLGLLPSAGVPEVIRKTTQKGEFRLNFKVLQGKISKETETQPADARLVYAVLKEAVANCEFLGEHRLVLDNLDYVVTARQSQFHSISALIHAADRMNSRFKKAGLDLKIIVMCRTDIFDKLPGSNNVKVRRDSGVVLDWYQDTKDYDSTNIVRLANHRATVSLQKDTDVFTLLPAYIRSESTKKVLLDNTRHLPRDMIELMNSIKSYTKPGANPTSDDVENGMRKYSREYFRKEIRDELDGFLAPDVIEALFRLLRSMRKRQFTLAEISAAKDKYPELAKTDLVHVLRLLYDTGGIGNVDARQYFTFKYRNPYSDFDELQDIVIHWGLARALH